MRLKSLVHGSKIILTLNSSDNQLCVSLIDVYIGNPFKEVK